MKDAPSPATWASEMNKDRTAQEDLPGLRPYQQAFLAKLEARPCTLGVGCEQYGVCYADAHGQPSQCNARPAEPAGLDLVWYRGWECGYNHDAANYGGQGWLAYKGGADLDAPQCMAATYAGLLDEINEAEEA